MKYKVSIMEYERGWGAKLDSVEEFDDEEKALEFIRTFNSRNTEAVAPDWYMVAQKGW